MATQRIKAGGDGALSLDGVDARRGAGEEDADSRLLIEAAPSTRLGWLCQGSAWVLAAMGLVTLAVVIMASEWGHVMGIILGVLACLLSWALFFAWIKNPDRRERWLLLVQAALFCSMAYFLLLLIVRAAAAVPPYPVDRFPTACPDGVQGCVRVVPPFEAPQCNVSVAACTVPVFAHPARVVRERLEGWLADQFQTRVLFHSTLEDAGQNTSYLFTGARALSLLIGFPDDIMVRYQCVPNPELGGKDLTQVWIHSVQRLGTTDFGVNERRVTKMEEALHASFDKPGEDGCQE